MVDLGLKPSLAQYGFRPDSTTLEFFKSGVASAQDDDELLFAMVEREAAIADAKARMGDPRRALSVLKRAHRLADAYGRRNPSGGNPAAARSEMIAPPSGVVPSPMPELPARSLAIAALRLQVCAVLSRFSRHHEAVSEARAAKHQTDQLWKTLTGASIELAVAVEAGDVNRPAPELRRLLLNPPKWLVRLVEVSIQCRQCLAVELEFTGYAEPASAAPSVVNSSATQEGLPVPPLTPEQEVAALHHEAVILAQRLLPRSHPVREAAERAAKHGELRRRARSASSIRPTEAGLGSQPSIHKSPQEESLMPQLLKRGRSRTLSVPALSEVMGDEPGALLAVDGSMGLPRRVSPEHAHPMQESLFAARDDVVRSRSSTAEPMMSMADSLHQVSGSNSRMNPFEEWRKKQTGLMQMSMTEIKCRTFEGIKDMQDEVKRENQIFKQVTLKECDPDRLFENRNFHTQYGSMVKAKSERYFGAWKMDDQRIAEAALEQKRASQRELFGYYGVAAPRDADPSFKAWGKVLRKSQDRTSAGKEHNKRERAREVEEARRREQASRYELEVAQRALQQDLAALKEKSQLNSAAVAARAPFS
jgi:hypothetical protein